MMKRVSIVMMKTAKVKLSKNTYQSTPKKLVYTKKIFGPVICHDIPSV